jgi:penicillin-binding protein 1A
MAAPEFQFTFIKRFWQILIGGTIAVFLLFFLVTFGLFGDMPDVEDLENPKNALSSEILGDDGTLIGSFYLENRINTAHKDIAPCVFNALEATEDVRFRSHSGIDVRGTIRAIAALGRDGGASTITQQLSENLFYRFQKPSTKIGMIMQKFKEWVIAVELERRYTKNEIITMYLNTVPFSGISFGIESASKEFFNKKPKELKIEEAAVLIGMLKANHRYNPKFNPDKSLLRRNTVLEQMNKYKFLSDDSVELLKTIPIKINYRSAEMDGMAQYFKYYLGEYLKPWCKERGIDLYRSGLKIYTTLNPKLQQYAEKAVQTHMPELQGQFDKSWGKEKPWRYVTTRQVIPGFIESALKKTERYKGLAEEMGDDSAKIIKELKKPIKMTVFSWRGDIDTLMSPYDSMSYIKKILMAGFIAVQPETGHVKAWVGGINHKFFKYDHVNKRARRQVGSTFKPIVYATAIDINQMTPCTEFPRERTVFQSNGEEWSPRNADGKSGGVWTMTRGLALSDNLITAQVMKSLGEDAPEIVVKFAERVGIEENRIPKVPSICLGTMELSPFEMASAYSAFANNGLWIEPSFLLRIEDKNGNVLEEFNQPKTDQVLSAGKAYMMFRMLENVVNGGTGSRIRGGKFAIEGHIAGKTGTTQGSADGWFMGLTKNLVCATWVGADDPTVRIRGSLIGQGSNMSLPIYGYFLKAALADKSTGIVTDPLDLPEGFDASILDCSRRSEAATQHSPANIPGLGE